MKSSQLIFLMLLFACRKQHERDGYRVMSYDAATHEWTILRTGTFDGKFLRKRLKVICTSYKWADHEGVTGPEACHLQVGLLIIPNPFPERRQDFVDVYEMPGEVLSVTEGDGPDRVMQQVRHREIRSVTR